MNTAAAITTEAPVPTPVPVVVIYADPSSGPFLLFVFMNVLLFVCMFVVVLYLLKSQREFAAKMNLMRRDRARKTERVADRTVFDFHHSPDEPEIMETHDRVMAAFSLDGGGDDDDGYPDEPTGSNPLTGAKGRGQGAAPKKREPKKLSPFEL
jgi:hypothetical protein